EELKKFDTLYVSIKHEQEHHKNTKSLSEADDKLERLLERYNLDDALKAFRIKYKHDSKQQPNINKLADDSAAKRTAKFSDSRLQNLWSKVSTDQDVAAHELNDLHRQFEGLQKIIERYNEVKKDLNELDENEVHDVVDHQQLVREAKALNSGIEDTIEHLKSQIEAVKENPFENESVRKLWLKELPIIVVGCGKAMMIYFKARQIHIIFPTK
uniref:Syntaxin n=1 Tax=Bursaphelenchus xylophilus TaxID=6326 RepID=A0A1I7SKK0_BURXY